MAEWRSGGQEERGKRQEARAPSLGHFATSPLRHFHAPSLRLVEAIEGGADGGGEFGAEGECFGGPGHVEVVALSAGDDVDVGVHDELAGDGAVVLEEVVAGAAGGFLDGAAEGGEGPSEGGGGVWGEIGEGDGGFFGDEEGVAGADGVDVEEGEDVFVFVDAVAGDFATDEFGEDGVGHGGRVRGAGKMAQGLNLKPMRGVDVRMGRADSYAGGCRFWSPLIFVITLARGRSLMGYPSRSSLGSGWVLSGATGRANRRC